MNNLPETDRWSHLYSASRRVIACETVIEEMLPFMPEDMPYEILDFGLHINPAELKKVLQEKIDEASQRMYGGKVTNPKVLGDLQLEIDSLKRRRTALEERQFEALMAAEAAEVRHAAVQEQLRAASAEAAVTHGSLLDERGRLAASLEQLATAREAISAQVLAADMVLYDQLRPTKKGRAVSKLDDGGCSTCGVAPSSSRIQSARQGNDLILCGNCGRILCAD